MKVNVKVFTVLLTAGLGIFLARSAAADFSIHTNFNIFGLDAFPSVDAPLGSEQEEVQFCERSCAGPGCMAFTWVRRGVQGPTAKCWLKSSPMLIENHALSLLTFDRNTTTGVKILSNRSCWARHIANLKFCSVVAGIDCPSGSTTAFVRAASPSDPFSRVCVTRMNNDPGGLPNCTDAFGGPSGNSGELGNAVNQACLDAP